MSLWPPPSQVESSYGPLHLHGAQWYPHHRSSQTVAKIDEAAEALKGIAKSGKKILFVATKNKLRKL